MTAAPTTDIYTLSLHDALPISTAGLIAIYWTVALVELLVGLGSTARAGSTPLDQRDRKSTRLNSSHVEISYAVFCLKKKSSRSIWPRGRASTTGTICRVQATTS